MSSFPDDDRYFELLANPIRVCRDYRPKLGHGRKAGYSLEEFQQLYKRDPFYAWFGLDSPLMYAAHKAAGGMTSVYRQIGIGCQWLFQQILQDTLGLTPEQATWSYMLPRTGNRVRKLALDARIELSHVANKTGRKRVQAWVAQCAEHVKLPPKTARRLLGVVFEVRQGYKSKDSKRQNADIANAANAYAHDYLPVLLLLSLQIDEDVAERYHNARWVILTGGLSGSTVESTYSYCSNVVGYDLGAFFQRNSHRLKDEVLEVVRKLLQ